MSRTYFIFTSILVVLAAIAAFVFVQPTSAQGIACDDEICERIVLKKPVDADGSCYGNCYNDPHSIAATTNPNTNNVPVITLVDGDMTINVGGTFTDPGFSAADVEDGDLTTDVVVAGDIVDTSVAGTYTVTYDVVDSIGAAAVQVVRVITVAQVLGATDNASANEQCQFTTYLKPGDVSEDVKLMQQFLNDHMNAGLVVDGSYGPLTTQAVHNFQNQYFDDIIGPWLPLIPAETTGVWYKTTRMKANQILGCTEDPVQLEGKDEPFSLDEAKEEEMEAQAS